MRSYKHGIASYPTKWRGYVVSPQKICLQFDAVQCKTRVNKEYESELLKPHWGDKALPIDRNGTEIEFLAVGIPLHLHKIVFLELLKAYEEHINKYGPELIEFLSDLRGHLNELLRRVT